ncbi:MAG TPA: PIN domain-containing protein [Acidimicrobiales bacterium]|nr:PIN domain-containing protein [Acidimicrobiales bacterium]
MSAVDSSIVVAALVQWHEGHETARQQAHGQIVPAHAYFESYAVLTSLPGPGRLAPLAARELLAAWFPPERVIAPPADATAGLVERMAASDIGGGAVYDALIALTAAASDQELHTRDRRAERTYQRLGVAYRLVA